MALFGKSEQGPIVPAPPFPRTSDLPCPETGDAQDVVEGEVRSFRIFRQARRSYPDPRFFSHQPASLQHRIVPGIERSAGNIVVHHCGNPVKCRLFDRVFVCCLFVQPVKTIKRQKPAVEEVAVKYGLIKVVKTGAEVIPGTNFQRT